MVGMSIVDIKLTPVEIEILLSLVAKARHGYGIKLAVEERTDGRIQLGSGTLYVAIRRLEKAGLVKGEKRRPGPGTEKLRRRYYKLTPAGKSVLKSELAHLDELVRHAKALKAI
jgi:DNA-binding PadR family transcriptional regulator